MAQYMDQATTLRQIIDHNRAEQARSNRAATPLRAIAITSGKGGVGKSNIVLNLCLALSRRGRRVFLLDADMGLANVDVLLGLTPKHTLEHVMSGQMQIEDIVVKGAEDFWILPSSSGISELSELSYDQQMYLFQELSRLEHSIDYLFIDTGAGISSNVMRFNASANEVIVVANPEPTSITDAYALMKLLAIKYHIREFSLIANSVNSPEDGRSVYERLNGVCEQFLKVNLSFLGSVPLDPAIPRAVRKQRPVLLSAPQSPAARNLERIAQANDERDFPTQPAASAATPATKDGTASFWDRLLHWKKAK